MNMAIWIDKWTNDGTFEIAKVRTGNFLERWSWLELFVWSEEYASNDVEFFWDASMQSPRTKDKTEDEMSVARGAGFLSAKDAKAAARAWLTTVCGCEVLSNEDPPKVLRKVLVPDVSGNPGEVAE